MTVLVRCQPGKFDLPGLVRKFALLHHPVVQGAVRFIFQRTQGVGDPLDGVLNGMGEVVHGVNAPLVALMVVASYG